MLITLSILGLLFLILYLGNERLAVQFRSQVKTLFNQSNANTTQVFHSNLLENLPEPVERYFKYVLKEGQPYINYVRLKHDGQFKTGLDKQWIVIKGEEYFTTETPSFIWKGTTNLFTARDMYMGNKGRLVVSLLSIYNVVDAQGEQYNQGELLRWLSESIWFPTNLLPSERLNWEAIDSNSAKLNFSYNGLKLYFVTTFNANGEIIQMETKRFMDKERLENWVIKASNYKEMNGVKVPTTAEAIWRLADRDYPYAKFNVTALEYDVTELF